MPHAQHKNFKFWPSLGPSKIHCIHKDQHTQSLNLMDCAVLRKIMSLLLIDLPGGHLIPSPMCLKGNKIFPISSVNMF